MLLPLILIFAYPADETARLTAPEPPPPDTLADPDFLLPTFLLKDLTEGAADAVPRRLPDLAEGDLLAERLVVVSSGRSLLENRFSRADGPAEGTADAAADGVLDAALDAALDAILDAALDAAAETAAAEAAMEAALEADLEPMSLSTHSSQYSDDDE